MMPSHHPPEEDLLAYASGAGPEWVSLIVACHLTYCPACRSASRWMEDLGGALLDAAETAGAPPVLPELSRSGPADVPRPRAAALPPGLPWPLAGFVSGAARFRFLAPGVQQIRLDLSVGGVPARVVRFRPGFTVPEHRHQGIERVLVLDGKLEDRATREVFVTGDLSYREDGSVHSQHVPGDSGHCVCLVVSEAPLVPSTLWGKVLQRITGV